MANSIHAKRGKRRTHKAKLAISGLSGSPVSFDYAEKKQYKINVPYADTPHTILDLEPTLAAAQSASTIRRANLIAVTNVGMQAAGLSIKVPDWTLGTNDGDASAGASSVVQWLLKPGTSFILPGTQAVCTSAVNDAATQGRVEYGYDGAKKDTENEKPMQYNVFHRYNATATDKFYSNDVKYVNVSALATDGLGGYMWDDKVAAGANLTFGLGDGKTGLFNHGGVLAVGGASTATTLPYYTPGSIAVRFMEQGYSPFGLNGQSSSTKSGLAVDTKYGFKITLDGGTQQEVLFQTHTSDTTWGTGVGGTGVLWKINEAINKLKPWKAGNSLHIPAPRLVIEDGDVVLKLTTAKRTGYSGTGGVTAIATAAPSTAGYADCLNVGSIPANWATNFQKPLFKELHREAEMMFDDSYGNLTIAGSKVGEIDYSTGMMFFKGAPPFSNNFKCEAE